MLEKNIIREDDKLKVINIFQRKKILAYIFVAVVTFVSFLPCLYNGFVNWDDPNHLVENVLTMNLNGRNIQSIFTSSVNRIYIPLTILSFSIERHFFGLNPFVYHLDNLLLHMGVTLFVFLFCLQCGLSMRAALFSAILFGVHPIHVESVAWITERKDVLYAFFYIFALIQYGKYLRRKVWLPYILSIGLGFISMLAKPMAVSLPLVLLLCDWFYGRRFDYKVILEKVPFFLYGAGLGWLTYSHNLAPTGFSITERILIGTWALIFHLWKFFFPFNLLPLYQFPQSAVFLNPQIMSSIFLLIFFLLLIFRLRKNRLVIFAAFYYLFSIFFLLRAEYIVADRFMYLPSLGLCMVMGVFCDNVRMRADKNALSKTFFAVFFVGIFVYLPVKTFLQCRIWKGSFTLWEYVLSKRPNSSVALSNLGSAYLASGDDEKAVYFLKRAVSLEEDDEAYTNLGTIFYRAGEFKKADEYLQKALTINPEYAPALNTLGLVLEKQDDYIEAERSYIAALDYGPHYLAIRFNLAKLYGKQGRYQEAFRLYQDNLVWDPNHKNSLRGLLLLYLETQQSKKVIELANKILAVNRDETFLIQLGSQLAEQNYPQIALAFFVEAVHLNPRSKEAYMELGKLYGNYEKFDKAILFFEEALGLDPKDAQVEELLEKATEMKAKMILSNED